MVFPSTQGKNSRIILIKEKSHLFFLVRLFQWCGNIYCLHLHFSLQHIIAGAVAKIPSKTWKFCRGTTGWEGLCEIRVKRATAEAMHLFILKLWTKPSCGCVQEQINTWSYLFSIAICCFLHFIKKSSRSFKVLNMKQKATEVSKLIRPL